MRVGIDYSLATTHAPGLGRYCRELVRACANLVLRPELALWEWGSAPRNLTEQALGLPSERITRRRWAIPNRFQPTLGRLGWHPNRQMGPLVGFHRILPERPFLKGLPYTLPVVEIPPQGSAAWEALARDLSAASAAFVFSSDVARRLVTELHAAPEQVVQVPVGAEHWWRDLAGQLPSKRSQLVVLGAQRAARRTLDVIAGFEIYCAQGGQLDLWLLGSRNRAETAIARAVAASPYTRRIHSKLPSEAAIPTWVAQSHALLHLAIDEGSPVTPLEAVRLGVHPVLERVPAFVEAFDQIPDSAPLWLPRNPTGDAIAQALLKVEGLPPREPLALAGFTWDACAKVHLATWERVFA